MQLTKLIPEDLHHCLSRIPRDVRKAMQTHGVIVGGGFIRATIAGEKVSDIDMFGPTKEKLHMVALELATQRGGRLHETQNAYTVLSPNNRMPLQFITRWLYQNSEEVVQDFDFSICQAAIYWDPAAKANGIDADSEEKTGAWRSVCSEYFYPDLASRRLRYLAPERAEDAGGSLLRVRKYLKRGYHIEAPSLAAVVARTVLGVEQIEKAMENCPEDQTPERWLTRVTTGLLREVDPMLAIDGLELIDEHEIG